MGLHSLRILAQAGFSGVFFAAKILRGELPRYTLPLPEFAANVISCSAPLSGNGFDRLKKKYNIDKKVNFATEGKLPRMGHRQVTWRKAWRSQDSVKSN